MIVAACLVAVAGCTGVRRRRAAKAGVPTAFAVHRTTAAVAGVVPPPFTVHPGVPGAPYPAPFFLNYNQVLTRYLDALQKDPALAKAYDGYYRGQTRGFDQLWEGIKRQADRLTDIASIYPGAALPMTAYRTVRGAISQGEKRLKTDVLKEDQLAGEVNRDIRFAIQKVALESRVQVLYDTSGGNPLFVDPLWDLTDQVCETLVKATASSLAEEGKEGPEQAVTGPAKAP